MLGSSQGLWLVGNGVDILQGGMDHMKNMPSTQKDFRILDAGKMESTGQGHKYTLD